jgi:hypothetical protein
MTDFQDLQKKERPTVNRERISKRDIKPLEVQFRLQTFYDPTDNTYKFRDINGNSIFIIDPNTGTLTFSAPTTLSGALSFTGTTTFNSLVRGLWPEIEIILAAETNDGFYTGNNSYEFCGPAATQYVKVRMNSTEWDMDVYDLYFEMIAGGDSGGALTAQIYNVTDSAAVTNTEITGGTADAWTRVRSTTPFTLATGVKEYAVQYKRTTPDTGYPSMGKAAIIARLKDL